MKIHREKVRRHITVLLDESRKPGALLDLDGNILHVNGRFSDEMERLRMRNLTNHICEHSIHQWNMFINQVNYADYADMDMNIFGLDDTVRTCKVTFMYFQEDQQVVVLFDNMSKNTDKLAYTYRDSFQSSHNFKLVVDDNGIIIDVNKKHSEFFDLPREYFCGNKVDVLLRLFSKNPHELKQYFNEVNMNGSAEMWQRFVRSPEDVRHFHITTFNNRETGMCLVQISDQTEKVLLEERITHSDSLSMVGELAASIAHEIRNPMTTMKGFIQLLRISSPEDSMKYLTVIDGEIERMESILTEMLILSKPSKNKKLVFSLEVVLEDMIQIVSPKALMDGITIIQKECELENTLIYGDVYKIKQAILNLIKNAFESISTKGIITIGLGMDATQQIQLSITDTGKGMSLSQINQIYLPFYSSKEGGTGLGLPFVLRTVVEHGGTVSVQSEVGVGTTFILSLPRATEQVLMENTDVNKVVS